MSIDFTLLDRETIERLHQRMKPVIRVNGALYQIEENYDLFNTSFLWDAKPTGYPLSTKFMRRIHTLHKFGYYGFFKPSVAEVLTCIGKHVGCDYYEIHRPETADDLNNQTTFVNNGLHLAMTDLYYRLKT